MSTGQDEIRSRLEALRRQTEAQLTARNREIESIVAASRDSNTDDEHDPEGATIGFERAQASALATATRRQLDDIGAALKRLQDGTYGTCERCGRPIAPGRLAARPTVRYCIECQQELDRAR